MKTNEYLFGTNDVPEFDPEVIMRRTELLKENLSELLDHTTYTRTMHESKKIRDILKAIKWHENINKMGDDDV